MNDIIRENNAKIMELGKKIYNCNGNYLLVGIDVDGVMYNVDPSLQEFLSVVDFRATKEYRKLIAGEESADSQEENNKSYAILDAILLEKPYVEILETGEPKVYIYPKPNYENWYVDKNLLPKDEEKFPSEVRNVDFINYMLANRAPNVFFIFVTHRNPDREAEIKIRELSRLCPNIDAILTPPYYMEGTNIMTDKGLYTQQRLSLDNLDNFIMLDDVKKICLAIRKLGGTDIRVLTEGFNETHTLADHLSKITNLDPYNLQFVRSYIKYAKENPEYAKTLDVPMKVKKL